MRTGSDGSKEAQGGRGKSSEVLMIIGPSSGGRILCYLTTIWRSRELLGEDDFIKSGGMAGRSEAKQPWRRREIFGKI